MARNGTHFSDSHFEKKLLNLKDTQESIQNLSAWCLSHKSDYLQIIKCWVKVVKKEKSELYLPLFYLANDIIQHSKKKGNHEIVSAWEPALTEATPLIREEKVIERVKRIFKIWEEREIYSSSFLKELLALLTIQADRETKTSIKQLDFETTLLIEKIHHFKSSEEHTNTKQKLLNESKIKITEIESLRTHVKERHKTKDFFPEFDASVARMEEYVRALEEETRERANLIKLLEQADAFYEDQKGEFKQVFTAYKQFGNRVKTVKRKLEEVVTSLPKIRSIDINPSNGNASTQGVSVGSILKLPDFSTAVQNPGQRYDGEKFGGEMDLDSRITSFLATSSHGVSGSFLGSHISGDGHTLGSTVHHQVDSFQYMQQFQQGANSFLDKTIVTSILGAPPPPPPPLPLGIPSIPIIPELPTSDVLPLRSQDQLLTSQHDQWGIFPSVHHPLPSKIPSWEGPDVDDNDDGNQISSRSRTSFYSLSSEQRGSKRPIDHRNLISLTGGPEKYSPTSSDTHSGKDSVIGEEEISSWLKVLRAQEVKERNTSELNKQVSSLLDSFGPPSSNRSSSRNRKTEDDNSAHFSDGHHSKHRRTTHSSRSLSESKDSTRRSDGESKTSSLVSAVVYPKDAYSPRRSEKRHSSRDRHSSKSRKGSQSEVKREGSNVSSSKRDTREPPSRFSHSSYQKSSSRW